MTTDFADPANFTSAAAVAVSVTAFRLVPNLVDVLPSLTLLTGAVLRSLNLGCSACLLLVRLFYFSVSFFLNKTLLAFCSFPCLAYPAVLRIPYRPVEKQERLRISM